MSTLNITVSSSWGKAFYGARLALPPQDEFDLSCGKRGQGVVLECLDRPQLGNYELGAWLVSVLPQKSRPLVKGDKYSSLQVLSLES